MRRTVTLLLIGALALAGAGLAPSAVAAGSIEGKKCPQAGVHRMSGGKEFVCAKRKGKLVWVLFNGGGGTPSVALPPISQFLTSKSERLPADLSTVDQTSPFLGARAQNPHQGIHVTWSNVDGRWSQATKPSDFPAIYAIADGVITRVDLAKQVGANTGQEISLSFARNAAGEEVSAGYSLEPFIPEPSPGFFAPFILVKVGQQVKKGDIIAYIYVPPTSDGATHLHLHLNAGQRIQSPSIFSQAVVDEFATKFGDRGGFEGGVRLPACIGYKVSADENPFGTGAADCL